MIDLRFVPLDKWPGEATKGRENARFRAKYSQTLDLLEDELKKIRAKEITVQAFFRFDQIRNDGWPYAAARPSAPGVILSFRKPEGPIFYRDGKPMVNVVALSFPCDRYQTIDDNLRAIALSLQALRAVDRYGVTKRAEQYAGWKRIEAPAVNGFTSKETAAAFIIAQQDTEVPAYSVIADQALRKEVYRRAAARLHPDSPTGSHELFIKLQQANAMLEAQ